MTYGRSRSLKRLVLYAVLLVMGLVILFPFFWMLSTSLKPNPDIIRRPPLLLPSRPTLEHFQKVFHSVPYALDLANSLFVAGMTTLITIYFSTMVGYALAKYKVVGLNLIFVLILSGLMIPPFTIAIPLYITASQIQLVNSLWGVIIPFSISNFGIFLMRQYCMGVPDDLIAAARIDGAGEFSILMRIVFPVVATGCAALGILKFLLTWNDLFWPLIMLTEDGKKTLTVMLATFIDFERFTDYGLLMATTTLVVAPVIVLFVIFQRRIIEGVALTGMKG